VCKCELHVLNLFSLIDFFKAFRTNVLLLWIVSNYILIVIFTNDIVVKALVQNQGNTNTAINPYFTFLLWSVASLSFIRFVFSVVYMIMWFADGLRTGGKRNPIRSVARVGVTSA
jgi:hypothetical protein